MSDRIQRWDEFRALLGFKHIYIVFVHDLIPGHNAQLVQDGLGDEHSIEGIFVNGRKSACVLRVLKVNFKWGKAVNLNFLYQVIRYTQFTHCLLDADFPDGYCTDKDQILSIDDGLSGRVRERGVVFQSPDEYMGV